MLTAIREKLCFADESRQNECMATLNRRLPCLESLAACDGAGTEELARAFVQLVWELEKYCHSVRDYPVESVFSPNYDVYRVLGLALGEHLFHGDRDRLQAFICMAMDRNIMWPRFGFLMLAHMALEDKKYEAAYAYSKQAHASYAHCGASYRTFYECWQACHDAGIKVQERYPLPADFEGHFCPYPFEWLVIRNEGDTIKLAPCRTSLWMAYAKSYPAEALLHPQTMPDFWNSREFQEIRRSILDGDFSYCSKLRCPILLNLSKKEDITDPYLRNIIDNRQLILPEGPRTIVCSYDEICNLTCPSCRRHKINPGKRLIDAFDRMADHFILPLVNPKTKFILLNASGEALASPHSLRLLNALPFDTCPDLEIHLMTNGELLASRWERLGPARAHVARLYISLDGISRETYEHYRRGGKLERFLDSMKFASRLRKNGDVKEIHAVMTIYPGNMREAKDIFEFCKQHGFDVFHINKFQNWGTLSPEEFMTMDVWNDKHPDYEEWVEIYHQLMDKKRWGIMKVIFSNLL